MSKFKVGDMVVGLNESDGIDLRGIHGVVKGFDPTDRNRGVAVEWFLPSSNVKMHTCYGLCTPLYGWYVTEDKIRHLSLSRTLETQELPGNKTKVSTEGKSGDCKCDIMVSGCTCGAIKPYSQNGFYK